MIFLFIEGKVYNMVYNFIIGDFVLYEMNLIIGELLVVGII